MRPLARRLRRAYACGAGGYIASRHEVTFVCVRWAGDVDMLPPGVQRSRPPNPLLVLFAVGGVAGLAAAYGSLSGDAPSSGPGEMPSVPGERRPHSCACLR